MSDEKKPKVTLWGNPIYRDAPTEGLTTEAEVDALKANLVTCYTVILTHLTRLGLLVGADQQEALHAMIDDVKGHAAALKDIK